MSSFPFLPRTISLVDRHSGIYQGTRRCRCSRSTGITAACNVQIERSRCTETSADAEHFYLITYSRFRSQRRARRQDARQGRGNAAGGSASLGAFRPRMPLPVARMAGSHGPLRPNTVDGRQRPFPGQRRRGGVLRTHEDGIRLSRALGGAYPRRGARPGRRLHPLVRPRAHQTVAWLDESGTIPSEPGNGCVIISKKTSAAPYPQHSNAFLFHTTIHVLLGLSLFRKPPCKWRP